MTTLEAQRLARQIVDNDAIPPAIKAIVVLNAEVDLLQSRVKELESQLEEADREIEALSVEIDCY